ncbi:fibroblast growth factor receptor 3-like [Patiria miniata]|uniref:receptor protein-tyrosine kinase n=1 Tax=Patiria miniata TaxID=46514 RepID=A0A913ZXJ6_PATMI|nr:fibroblast growth factor receptor 3-like [Patiria miniata]
MNSKVVKDNVNVKIGHLYRFTCNASGFINPANHITWLIEKEGQQDQIKGTCDWELGNNTYREASTEICLNITQNHSSSRIICRVVFPDNGEVAVYLSIETPNLGTSTPERATTFLSTSKEPVSDVTRLPIMPTVVIIPVASSVVICVAIAIFCIRRRKYQQTRTKEEVATSNEVSLTEVSAADEGAFGRSQRDYDFPRERIALHEVLGSGNFGHVYRATADGIYCPGIKVDVAVKILKKSADADVVADFEKEIAVQRDLMKHPNIVSMLGYCMETQPFYLILEYISGGNLQKFLRDKKDAWRDDPVEGAQPACPFQLLTFASEIANGMDYLSTMGCIHRDLATRNILLSDDLVCKLSDFGLARDVSETEQYERTSLGLIPVRWLALECLVENTYTTMSDVWSFGVLLWEIVTLGAHPYRGMSASQIIDALVEGFRLPTPAHCNKQLYTVMKECWRISPTRRPSFSNLKRILDIMIPDSQIYLAMEDFVADKYT